MEQALAIITLATTLSVCFFVILFLSWLLYLYAKKDIKFKNARVNLVVVAFDIKSSEDDKKLEELSERILQLEKKIEDKIDSHKMAVIIVVVVMVLYLIYIQGIAEKKDDKA